MHWRCLQHNVRRFRQNTAGSGKPHACFYDVTDCWAHSVALEWCTKLFTGMDDPNENETSSFKRFLETFCRDVTEPTRGSNDPSVRHVSYMLEQAEIEGESLQWALDYLCQTQWVPPYLLCVRVFGVCHLTWFKSNLSYGNKLGDGCWVST